MPGSWYSDDRNSINQLSADQHAHGSSTPKMTIARHDSAQSSEVQPIQTTGAFYTDGGSPITQAQNLIKDSNKQYTQFRSQLSSLRQNYTEQGYRDQQSAWKDTAAAKNVDVAEAIARQRAFDAAEKVTETLKALSPNGDTASELRAQRLWDRTKTLLDKQQSGDVMKTARKALDNADRSELGTLLQELPTYLEARDVPADWVEPEVGRVVPEFGAARNELRKAEQARLCVEFDAKRTRKAFDEGRALGAPLLDISKYDPDAGD